MKALKEKRISLRSLWRRGLVILSLFALVFASCGESSSSESGESSGGRRVTDIVFPEELTAFQYFGQEIDLTGLKVQVFYSDSATPTEVTYESAKANFSKYPRIATGTYDNTTNKFTGMEDVRVFYKAADGSILSRDMKFKYPVVGIKRDNAEVEIDDPVTEDGAIGGIDVFSGGLMVTGFLKNDEAWVDDKDFDFGGLTFWADYLDGVQRPLKVENLTWQVLPDYNRTGKGLPRNDDADKTYRGYVYITAGADVYKREDGTTPWTGGDTNKGSTKWNGGITVRRMIPFVHTVLSRDLGVGIEWVQTPKLKDYFFWQENTSSAWTDRLIAADAAIKVHYRGTPKTKTFTIKELAEQELIYWNPNMASDNELDNGVRPLDYLYVAKKTPATAPAGLIAHANPQIIVNYRGGRVALPVDVYTTFRSISIVNKSGQDLSLDDTDEDWDNDVDLPIGTDEEKFADMITVTATYRAYNSGEDTTLELKLAPATIKKGHLGEYYTTDFATERARAEGLYDPTNLKAKPIKGKVTIHYQVKSAEVETDLTLANNTIFGEPKDTKEINKGSKVTWQLPTK